MSVSRFLLLEGVNKDISAFSQARRCEGPMKSLVGWRTWFHGGGYGRAASKRHNIESEWVFKGVN